MILGSAIRAWRGKQRLGLRDVAREIGVSHGTLSRFENGENVDGETLAKILIWALGKSALEIG